MSQEFINTIRLLEKQFAELEASNIRLYEENIRLREENVKLRATGGSVDSNLNKNEAVKLYVAKLIGGVDVPPRIGYNLGHRWSQRTFQVLYSKVQEGNRWTWKRVFGLNGTAGYGRLILVGENKRTSVSASENGTQEYVLFSIPKSEVGRLTNSQGDIAVNVNPDTAKTPEARLLYSRYQVTAEELRRYNRAGSESEVI